MSEGFTPGPSPGEMPRWAERLLGWLASPHNRDVVLGDFAEVYQYIARREGRRRAAWWYAGQVVRSLPAFLANGVYFGGSMFRNYLKIAFRSLVKRKFYAALNIGGLAVGMAACLLIFQYVAFEYSFDTFHQQHEHLYRVLVNHIRGGEVGETEAFTWSALGPALEETVPEVGGYARFHPNYGMATIGYTDGQGQRIAFREEGLVYADSSFLSLFSFPLLRGDPARALTEPNTMLLSESAARRFFGTADPLGQTLEVRAWAGGDYTVTGVFKDVPANSHLQFDYLLPMEDLLQVSQYRNTEGWNWTNFITYVRLHPGVAAADVAQKVADVVAEHKREAFEQRGGGVEVDLQPLGDIHLYSTFDGNHGVAGNYKTVYFFTLIALFVLLIAWVNYVNLSTARALERAREVGIRKVAGARRAQVITQFLFESGLINGLGLVLAIGLAVLGLPYLRALTDVPITASIWRSPVFWAGAAGVFGVGTVLASFYPALVLSAFQPITVLKGRLGAGVTRDRLRQGLVVLQFAASIALLTGTYAVYRQVAYMRGLDLGLGVEQVLVIQGPSFLEEGSNYAEMRDVFKAELMKHPSIGTVATSAGVPGGGHNYSGPVRREGMSEAESDEIRIVWVNYDFLDTYGMDLAAGRNFMPEMARDSVGILLNEAAVHALGFASNDEVVDQEILIGGGDSRYNVVGVLNDFHWSSTKQPVDAFALALTNGGRYYSIKVQAASLDETLDTVRRVYDEVFPGNPFDYFFADRYFDEQYRADQRFGTLFGLFALFAVFVACLGLVGLSAFTATQRTKEIGVRKVLGASSGSIVRLLLFDFGKLVLAALVLTVPLMYFALNAWLADFAARISLSPDLFLVPGFVVLLAALLTVSYHTARAAWTNPARSLRYE